MTFWNSSNVKPFQKFKYKVFIGNELIWQAKSIELPKISMAASEIKYGLGEVVKWKKSPFIWKPIKIEIMDVQRESGLSTTEEIFYLLWNTHYYPAKRKFDKAKAAGKDTSELKKILLKAMRQNLPITSLSMSRNNLLNNSFFNNNERVTNIDYTESGKIRKIEIHKLLMNDKQVTTYLDTTNNKTTKGIHPLEKKEILNETWLLEHCLILDVDFGSADYSSDDINYISITLQPEFCRIKNSEDRPSTTHSLNSQ